MAFAQNAAQHLSRDARYIALLAAGSFIEGTMDEFSDLDLMIVCDEASYESTLENASVLAEGLGSLAAAVRGDYVGEPRLLVCLYVQPLLHVDLKLLKPDNLDALVERPTVLWSRDASIQERICKAEVSWPNKPPEWFEQRFWVWLHYALTKAGRGELYAARVMMSTLTGQILGPMIASAHGKEQRGARRLETLAPEWIPRLNRTVPGVSQDSVLEALGEMVSVYLDLRRLQAPFNPASRAQAAVEEYLRDLKRRYGTSF
jgi:hypothetical protein